MSDANEGTIADRMVEAAGQTQFVIVDLAGTASKSVVVAVSRADFVIVTTQGAEPDAEQERNARHVIRQQEKSMLRANPDYVLPYSVMLTRTNSAVRARALVQIQKSQIDAGIPVFKSELNERETFKAMFSFRQPLDHLRASAVTTVDKAIANVQDVSMTTKQIDPVAAPARANPFAHNDLNGLPSEAGDQAAADEGCQRRGGRQGRVHARPSEGRREPAGRARRSMTGRNTQRNVKVTGEILERFYAIIDGPDRPLGDVFEREVVALEEKMTRQGD